MFHYFIAAIGKECEKYMKQGALVPDQIMEDMIISEMKKMQSDAWLLDGELLFACEVVIFLYIVKLLFLVIVMKNTISYILIKY